MSTWVVDVRYVISIVAVVGPEVVNGVPERCLSAVGWKHHFIDGLR